MEFFTADLHLGGEKVIQKSSRPFLSHQEMDDALLGTINEAVGRDDVLYHLGDFAQCHVEQAMHYRTRIRCRNVVLVGGNHDIKNRRFKEFRKCFAEVHDIHEIKRDGILVVMCHYPIRCWHHWDKGSWMLHGHTHGEMKPLRDFHLVLDVGVDAHDYAPWSFREICEYMTPRMDLYHASPEATDVSSY